MKLTVKAELTGKEIGEQLLSEVYKQGVSVDNCLVTCIVLNKKDEPVEVSLDKVKFIFNKE
jgi:hypothetical protein